MGPCDESTECGAETGAELDVLVTLLERSGRELDKKAAKAIKALRAEKATLGGMDRPPTRESWVADRIAVLNGRIVDLEKRGLADSRVERDDAERARALLRHLFGGDDLDLFGLALRAEHEIDALRAKFKACQEAISLLQSQIAQRGQLVTQPRLINPDDLPCYDPLPSHSCTPPRHGANVVVTTTGTTVPKVTAAPPVTTGAVAPGFSVSLGAMHLNDVLTVDMINEIIAAQKAELGAPEKGAMVTASGLDAPLPAWVHGQTWTPSELEDIKQQHAAGSLAMRDWMKLPRYEKRASDEVTTSVQTERDRVAAPWGDSRKIRAQVWDELHHGQVMGSE